MYKLSRAHKDLVKQFVQITSTSDNVGIAFCRHFGWNLQVAVNEFFNNPNAVDVPAPKAKKVDRKKLAQLFDKYKVDGEVIAGEGMIKFIAALGIEPTDVMTLVISWHLDTKTPCEFSRQEFMDGMERLGYDSIDKIKAGFGEMMPRITDWEKFRDFYAFTFKFNLIDGQKGLDRDIALQTWALVLKGGWDCLDKWLQFVEEKIPASRSIPLDTWIMLGEFVHSVGTDFSGFSENDAWPVVIDEFVEWMKQ